MVVLAIFNPLEAPSKCCKDFPRLVVSPEADDMPLSFLPHSTTLCDFELVVLQSAGLSFPIYAVPQETKDWQVSLGKGFWTSPNKLFRSLVNPGWLFVLDCFRSQGKY